DDNDNLVELVQGEAAERLEARFSYNAFGQPLTREARGKVTTLEYDALG
ncbi:MAG: hypothetical protein GWN84_03265, partial [Gammaproteobacteria bacterium]|nr:hypothetical protein [Gammaproteobacteria bacterium]NIU03231.1 hypothetical protein [Gammaproteobacteria bacterium]NIV50720.1 hypothetical protein [Gammaproteobacteria bacterium]NIX84506.1 hypothetical protein [Gammaproteobacteria bacterium]